MSKYGLIELHDLYDFNAPNAHREVVMCGECKYRYLDNHVWTCPFGLMLKGDDGFCNYGEREGE